MSNFVKESAFGRVLELPMRVLNSIPPAVHHLVRSCFGVTYEGLKLPKPPAHSVNLTSFGVTYEGLKLIPL